MSSRWHLRGARKGRMPAPAPLPAGPVRTWADFSEAEREALRRLYSPPKEVVVKQLK